MAGAVIYNNANVNDGSEDVNESDNNAEGERDDWGG